MDLRRCASDANIPTKSSPLIPTPLHRGSSLLSASSDAVKVRRPRKSPRVQRKEYPDDDDSSLSPASGSGSASRESPGLNSMMDDFGIEDIEDYEEYMAKEEYAPHVNLSAYLKSLEEKRKTEEKATEDEPEPTEEEVAMEEAHSIASSVSHSSRVCDLLEKSGERALEIWKRTSSEARRVLPSDPEIHNCLALSCDVARVLYDAYLMLDDDNEERLHVCVPNGCAEDGMNSSGRDDLAAHYKQLTVRSHLYVCTRTGIPHWCGSTCQTIFYNDDSQAVCQLTKEVFGVKIHDTGFNRPGSGWRPISNPHIRKRGRRYGWEAKRQLYALEELTLENLEELRLLSESLSKSNIDIRKLERENSPRTPKQAKNLAWLVIYLRVLKIFSDARMIDDMAKNEKIADDKKGTVEGYLAKCTQHSVIPVFSEMMQLAIRSKSKSSEIVEMAPSERQRRSLADRYTHKIMALWYIITTRTPMGKQNPRAFPFEEFVTAALHVFETGVAVNEDDVGYHAIIVPVDPVIAKKPVTEWVEKNLHERVRTEKQRNALLRKAQEMIETALYSAVKDGFASPAELMLDDSVSIESMEENVFLHYYSTKKTGDLTKAATRNKYYHIMQAKDRSNSVGTMSLVDKLPTKMAPALLPPKVPVALRNLEGGKARMELE